MIPNVKERGWRAPARLGRRMFILACMYALPGAASAQSPPYPDRPIRLLVGYPAGGGVDAVARLLAPRLQSDLGQAIVVENRTGASGAIAADVVAKAAPDGYTLFVGESSTLIAPYLQIKLPFDPVKSFSPVAGLFRLPLMIIANNDFKSSAPKDMVAALKAEPGRYAYGSPGIGTVQHLAFELFKARSGTSVVHIPYWGATQIIPDVNSGQVALGVVTAGSVMPQVKAGRVKAIALMGPDKLPGVAGIPSLADQFPGFDAAPRIYLFAPARTPGAIVERLGSAIQKAMADPTLAAAAAQQGAVAAFLPPGALAIKLADESQAWSTVIAEQKIVIE